MAALATERLSRQWMTPNTPNGGRKLSQADVEAKGATERGKRQVGLENQSEFWASPQARARRDAGYPLRSDGRLRNQAQDWLTPHGLTDHLEGVGGEFAEQATTWEPSHPARQIPGGLTFWQRVRILLLLCRQLRRALPSPYNKVRSMFKRKLNPDFVDWLMGWPIGFTSEGRVFSAEEMELYRFRQRQSLRCLLGE